MMTIEEKLTEALKALGQTPEEVLAELRQRGYKNRPARGEARCTSCPVARYLSDAVGVPISVNGFRARLASQFGGVSVPQSVRRAIERLDEEVWG